VVDCNLPPKGKRRARGEGSSELNAVSPRERVREFQDEYLTVTGKEFSNKQHQKKKFFRVE